MNAGTKADGIEIRRAIKLLRPGEVYELPELKKPKATASGCSTSFADGSDARRAVPHVIDRKVELLRQAVLLLSREVRELRDGARR